MGGSAWDGTAEPDEMMNWWGRGSAVSWTGVVRVLLPRRASRAALCMHLVSIQHHHVTMNHLQADRRDEQ